jgi:hypothetical protein
MRKLIMICVLVGATIINTTANQEVMIENTSTNFSESLNGETDQPLIKLEKVAEKKYQLSYMKLPTGKLTVSIRAENGRIIYRDVIFAEKFFSKNYDLTHLELGNYHFEVKDAQSEKLMAQEIHLLPETDKSTQLVSVEVLGEDRLAIFMDNAEGLVRTLKIFDELGLIYEEAVTSEEFAKKFKFENVDSISKLTIQVSDSNGDVQYISSL